MPKLNGLQLLERIRDTHTGCRTIIVSGYNEFTYAKEALTLGVRSYILKPIEEEELYEAICSLTEELSRERSKQRFIDLANYQLEQHREYLQGVFFNDWIEGKLSSGERQDQKELLSVHIGEEAALILVSTQNNRNLSLRMGDGRISDDVYQFALKNILRELLGNASQFISSWTATRMWPEFFTVRSRKRAALSGMWRKVWNRPWEEHVRL